MQQPLALTEVKRVLCIGAHVDDIEIGCGGALLRLQEECPGVEIQWMVATCDDCRAAEARSSASAFLNLSQAKAGAATNLHLLDFRDGYLPYEGAAVKDAFFKLRDSFEPEIVFTHRLEDRHQDHRLLAELTWNTYRNQLVLEYEIAKYEGDLGQPNCFVPLSEKIAARKVDLLMECFESQRSKTWFTPELFWAMLRLRGVEAKAESGLAEAFTARKIVL